MKYEGYMMHFCPFCSSVARYSLSLYGKEQPVHSAKPFVLFVLNGRKKVIQA